MPEDLEDRWENDRYKDCKYHKEYYMCEDSLEEFLEEQPDHRDPDYIFHGGQCSICGRCERASKFKFDIIP